MRKVAIRKDSHPLYKMYHKMLYLARRDPAGFDPRWGDFYLFLEDVGERPAGHVLWRKDKAKPYGPDNFEWTSKMTRMVRNLPPNAVQAVLSRYREDVKAKYANVVCPRSNELFNQIKKNSQTRGS